jgi:hypothetical protein
VRADRVVGELKLPLLHLLQVALQLPFPQPAQEIRVILEDLLYSQLLQVEEQVEEQVEVVVVCHNQVVMDGIQSYPHPHMEHLDQ